MKKNDDNAHYHNESDRHYHVILKDLIQEHDRITFLCVGMNESKYSAELQ